MVTLADDAEAPASIEPGQDERKPDPMALKPVLDAQFAPILEALAQGPSVSDSDPADIRAMWDVSVFGAPEPVGEIRDIAIPAEGATIPARLYRPKETTAGLIVYFHGGGWVLGSLETHDLPLRAFANRTGAAVLSVDYRLAPEHPFPTGLEDCYAALCWASEHLTDLTGDAGFVIVGGDSAGGNLAAAVALAARDRHGPRIDGQLLIYPATDARCDTPSYAEHRDVGLLTARDMRWFWRQYIGDGGAGVSALASPCLATSHRDLPPAIIAIAEFDPLRDDGIAYAEQLRAAGVQVIALRYDTLPHGFFNYLNLVDGANAAFVAIAEQVRLTFTGKAEA